MYTLLDLDSMELSISETPSYSWCMIGSPGETWSREWSTSVCWARGLSGRARSWGRPSSSSRAWSPASTGSTGTSWVPGAWTPAAEPQEWSSSWHGKRDSCLCVHVCLHLRVSVTGNMESETKREIVGGRVYVCWSVWNLLMSFWWAEKEAHGSEVDNFPS